MTWGFPGSGRGGRGLTLGQFSQVDGSGGLHMAHGDAVNILLIAQTNGIIDFPVLPKGRLHAPGVHEGLSCQFLDAVQVAGEDL